MTRLTRDGTAEPVLRDQILRRKRRQEHINSPCSADQEQDWQPYPVDPYEDKLRDTVVRVQSVRDGVDSPPRVWSDHTRLCDAGVRWFEVLKQTSGSNWKDAVQVLGSTQILIIERFRCVQIFFKQ